MKSSIQITDTTQQSTIKPRVFPLLWQSDFKDKSITRISECTWEEVRNEISKSEYEFVDFNQQNGLYLFDKEKRIFINMYK